MRIIGWGATDVGRKRNHNEDSFLCNNEIALYAVADGMGGHLGGERASRMAVEILEKEIVQVRNAGLFDARPPDAPPGAPHPIASLLRKAVVEADRHIYEAALSNPDLAGMGTTLTTAVTSTWATWAIRAPTCTATGGPGSSARTTPGSRSRCGRA